MTRPHALVWAFIALAYLWLMAAIYIGLTGHGLNGSIYQTMCIVCCAVFVAAAGMIGGSRPGGR
jgi:hypothetical protein